MKNKKFVFSFFIVLAIAVVSVFFFANGNNAIAAGIERRF